MIRRITSRLYRQIRDRLGMSQADAARATGKSRMAVYRWETGKQIPSAKAEAILLEAAGITPLGFVETLLRVLPAFIEELRTGKPLAPEWAPPVPEVPAAELYHARHRELDAEQRAAIEVELSRLGVIEGLLEQLRDAADREIGEQIRAAVGGNLVPRQSQN